jgi:hypothetical protein
LTEIYNLIKSDAYAYHTKALRALKDPKEARKYKATYFDYVTFSGLFSSRSNVNLQTHSGLLCTDFDHIDDVYDLGDKLLDDPCFETELLFISPSGDGLKWIIPIDISEVLHQDYFRAVSNYILETYKLKVDLAGSEVSRACFLPHDPEVYINPKYV